MKAILEYNLPEELEEYETAMNGGRALSFIHDVENSLLRKMSKYNRHPVEDRELTEDELNLVSAIVDKYYDLKSEIGLT